MRFAAEDEAPLEKAVLKGGIEVPLEGVSTLALGAHKVRDLFFRRFSAVPEMDLLALEYLFDEVAYVSAVFSGEIDDLLVRQDAGVVDTVSLRSAEFCGRDDLEMEFDLGFFVADL